jgi:hypothetical protein
MAKEELMNGTSRLGRYRGELVSPEACSEVSIGAPRIHVCAPFSFHSPFAIHLQEFERRCAVGIDYKITLSKYSFFEALSPPYPV